MPTSPLPPEMMNEHKSASNIKVPSNNSQRSRRSIERERFQAKVDTFM